jgi:hypothetical protein
MVELQHKEICKNKVFSMSVSENAGIVATGHDKVLSVWNIKDQKKINDTRPLTLKKTGS